MTCKLGIPAWQGGWPYEVSAVLKRTLALGSTRCRIRNAAVSKTAGCLRDSSTVEFVVALVCLRLSFASGGIRSLRPEATVPERNSANRCLDLICPTQSVVCLGRRRSSARARPCAFLVSHGPHHAGGAYVWRCTDAVAVAKTTNSKLCFMRRGKPTYSEAPSVATTPLRSGRVFAVSQAPNSTL